MLKLYPFSSFGCFCLIFAFSTLLVHLNSNIFLNFAVT